MKSYIINAKPSNFEASIEKAKKYFSLKSGADVTISMAGGNYAISSPIQIDGTNYNKNSSLRIIPNSSKKTIFSSLINIDSSRFEKVIDKPYYVCELTKEELSKIKSKRTIYVNDRLGNMSSSKEYITPPPFDGYTFEDGLTKEFNVHHKMYIPKECVDEVQAENFSGLEMRICLEWEYKIYHIKRVDLSDTHTNEKGEIFVAIYIKDEEIDSGNPNLITRCNRRFKISNSISTLKEEEYVLDYNNSKLYFYPKKDISEYKISYPTCTNVMEIKNLNNIFIKGLTFTGLDDEILARFSYRAGGQAGRGVGGFDSCGALCIDYTNNCTVDSCDFTELPYEGINMHGTLENVTIKNCKFTQIGGTAIRMGDSIGTVDNKPYGETPLVPRNVVVENNYVKDCGRNYYDCCAMFFTHGDNMKIVHNTIINCPYTGISVGWSHALVYEDYGKKVNNKNVEIAYNYINNFMTRLLDGGAIYVLGGNAPKDHVAYFNNMHDNYIVEGENTCPDDKFFSCLYHDDASTNWHTYNNVVYHNENLKGCSTRVYCQRDYSKDYEFGKACYFGITAWNILINNNYFINCSSYEDVFCVQEPNKLHEYIDGSRNLRQTNSHYIKNKNQLNKYPEAKYIIKNSGCTKMVEKRK